MNNRNLTISLPEDLVSQLEMIAASRNASVSEILTRTLRQIVEGEDGYNEAQRGMLKDLRQGYKLGTHGKRVWTRDEVHVR